MCDRCYASRYRDLFPDKASETKRNWVKANRERANEHWQRGKRKRRRLYRSWLNEFKMERGCADCGCAEHPAALDFDHLPGNAKAFGLAAGADVSRAEVFRELGKCEVVCANCHRIRTANRRRQEFVAD